MIHREVEEFDIQKLEKARTLVEEVDDYYYTSINSRDLHDRLQTIIKKTTSIIDDAREWQSTHDRFGNRRST